MKKLTIEYIDGTTEEPDWVDDCGVQDGVLWLLVRNSDTVVHYPLASIRRWTVLQ